MMGPGSIEVPSRGQSLGEKNGSKTVSDLIDSDVYVVWNGTKGTPKGTVKYIENYGSPYDGDQVQGHFFPVKFSEEYLGKEILVGGPGGKIITPTEADPYLIIRLENVTVQDKISAVVQDTGEEIFELDFSKVTRNQAPSGKDAFNSEKTDYGRYGNNEAYYDGGKVGIAWRDAKATVTGKLKWVKGNGTYPLLKEDGYYFAFALNSWFGSKSITVDNGGKVHTASDTDWVCRVGEGKKPITVKCEDTVVAIFDLSKIEFGEKES